MNDSQLAEPHENTPQQHLGVILALYLIGLAIGGLYVGIVSPVRSVIQLQFDIGDAQGIWIITAYTLVYAACIPVVGALADVRGAKPIFLLCLCFFTVGSVICGASGFVGGLVVMLVGRVLQAIGACGMIPVANAQIALTFPPEKRGVALGLAAATSGLANVLGSGVGSAILGLLGNDNWSWVFFGCVPLCLVVILAGVRYLPQTRTGETQRIDVIGAVLFICVIGSLLFGLGAIDFSQIESLLSPQVWIALLACVALVVVFALHEKRVLNPIFHMEYVRPGPVAVVMGISLFVGGMMMAMTLVPQYAETVLGAAPGAGGYYVIAIGVFSLAGPIIAGKLIDARGPKPVMTFGLVVTAIGFTALAFLAVAEPSAWLVVVALCVVGLGLGFSMGAPTNYMVLQCVPEDQSASAVASLALVRQIGTTLSPSIYVGLIAAGGGCVGYGYMMVSAVVQCVAALLLVLVYKAPRAEAR